MSYEPDQDLPPMPEEAPLTFREKLDASMAKGCSTPGCDCKSDVMFLHSACHPGEAVGVFYNREHGTMTVFCQLCKEPVVTVAVA